MAAVIHDLRAGCVKPAESKELKCTMCCTIKPLNQFTVEFSPREVPVLIIDLKECGVCAKNNAVLLGFNVKGYVIFRRLTIRVCQLQAENEALKVHKNKIEALSNHLTTLNAGVDEQLKKLRQEERTSLNLSFLFS